MLIDCNDNLKVQNIANNQNDLLTINENQEDQSNFEFSFPEEL